MTRTHIHTIAAVLLLVALATPRVAGADYELRRGTLAGSGGQSSGGAFSARTTTSQPDAGTAEGGVFSVSGSIARGNPADCVALETVSGVFTIDGFCAGVRVGWDDNGAHATGYRVLRDGVEIGVTGVDVILYDDSTAVPGVVYAYSIVARNNCGDANASASAAGRRPLPPAAPSDLAATGVRFLPDSVVLNVSWVDHSADEVSQTIYLAGATVTPLATVPANVTSVQVLFPKASTLCFAVSASNCGLEAVSDTTCLETVGVSAVDAPTAFMLGPFAPTPFSSRTLVSFDVPRSAQVTIRVYDVGGRLCRTLEDGVFGPGRYAATWNGTDGEGHAAPSGIYFVEMRSAGYRKVGRLTRLR